ncbi:MAG: hypothetical protein WCL28_01255 [bacterium]
MTADRRTISRCPVCSGPSASDEKFPDGIRCKNSACRHNHSKIICPRCQAHAVVQASWRESKWNYTCGDCEHKWQSSNID